MIILDTNIISEMMRPEPNRAVTTWLNQQHSSDLFLTSITVAEISYGLFVLPTGKRKQQLQNHFKKFVNKKSNDHLNSLHKVKQVRYKLKK